MQRLLTRLGGGPLRPLATRFYRMLAAAASSHLRRRAPDASVYSARSLASGEIVPGLSDLDMVAVVDDDPQAPGAAHERMRRRCDRLGRLLPAGLAPDLTVYEQSELDQACSAPILTYGLDQDPPAAALFGTAPPHDESELRARPGLGAPAADWLLLNGRERRPSPPASDRQRLRIAAWLELQFWWRSAFDAIANAGRPWAAYTCVKLVSEPARILLALDNRSYEGTRREALRAAASAYPGDDDAFEDALDLLARIGSAPAAPLDRFTPHLATLSKLIAARLEDEIGDEPRTEVELLGTGEAAVDLPLTDWRAVAVPAMPDERFAAIGGDPGDLGRLRVATAGAVSPGAYLALRNENLLVLPVPDAWRRGIFRAVQCPLTDPVSFALLNDAGHARFPDVPGWSAADWAARAVAEHAAWLRRSAGTQPFDPTAREWLDGGADRATGSQRALAKLLTGLRAALLAESVRNGEPQLALTVGVAAARLGDLGFDPNGVAAEAAAAVAPPRSGDEVAGVELVAPLRDLVSGMPAYAGAVPSS